MSRQRPMELEEEEEDRIQDSLSSMEEDSDYGSSTPRQPSEAPSHTDDESGGGSAYVSAADEAAEHDHVAQTPPTPTMPGALPNNYHEESKTPNTKEEALLASGSNSHRLHLPAQVLHYPFHFMPPQRVQTSTQRAGNDNLRAAPDPTAFASPRKAATPQIPETPSSLTDEEPCNTLVLYRPPKKTADDLEEPSPSRKRQRTGDDRQPLFLPDPTSPLHSAISPNLTGNGGRRAMMHLPARPTATRRVLRRLKSVKQVANSQATEIAHLNQRLQQNQASASTSGQINDEAAVHASSKVLAELQAENAQHQAELAEMGRKAMIDRQRWQEELNRAKAQVSEMGRMEQEWTARIASETEGARQETVQAANEYMEKERKRIDGEWEKARLETIREANEYVDKERKRIDEEWNRHVQAEKDVLRSQQEKEKMQLLAKLKEAEAAAKKDLERHLQEIEADKQRAFDLLTQEQKDTDALKARLDALTADIDNAKNDMSSTFKTVAAGEIAALIARKDKEREEAVRRAKAEREAEIASLLQKTSRRDQRDTARKSQPAQQGPQQPAAEHNGQEGGEDMDIEMNAVPDSAGQTQHSSTTTQPSPSSGPSRDRPSSSAGPRPSASSQSRGTPTSSKLKGKGPKRSNHVDFNDVQQRMAEERQRKRTFLRVVSGGDESDNDSEEEEEELTSREKLNGDDKATDEDDTEDDEGLEGLDPQAALIAKIVQGAIVKGVGKLMKKYALPQQAAKAPKAKGTHGNQTTRKREEQQRKRNDLQKEKVAEEKWEQNGLLGLVRQVFKDEFNVEQMNEFSAKQPPAVNEVKDYEEEKADGPVEENLRIDLRAGPNSQWNRKVQDILLAKVLQKRSGRAWDDFPDHSDDYYREMIEKQIERAAMAWREGRPRTKDVDGAQETFQEVEDRMVQKKLADDKRQRAYGRRRAKYRRRLKTIRQMIAIKRLEGATDIELWEWLEDLFLSLGEDGQSSDESDIDTAQGVQTFHVRTLDWRREMEQEIKTVDIQRTVDADVFTRKGARPTVRVRGGAKGSSRRPPPIGLSKSLYKKEWLNKLGEEQREKLQINERKFEWKKFIVV